MVNCVRRSTILYISACFWLLAAVLPVFGGGSRDRDLSKADELINAKKYDEAIRILSDFARRNPDSFDLAQQRFRKILQIREEFNRVADEIIDTLLNDPDNSEKILGLTKRLWELEDGASPLVMSFVSRTQEIAQFNVNRNRLRDILIRGREQLDRGESEAALRTYSGGMEFMRDEFFAAGYGEAVENEVRRETARVNSVLDAFRASSSSLSAISAELVRAINSGNLQSVPEIINRLTPAMDRFIGLRRELHTSVAAFDRILEELRASDPEMGDRNHLSFLSRVIHGRAGEPVQEGMLGAFETYWKNSAGNVVTAIMQNAERANSNGLEVFNSGEYSNSAAALQRIENYVVFSPLFFEKHRQLNENRRNQQVTLFDTNIFNEDIPSFTAIKSMSEAGRHLRQAAGLSGRLNIDRTSLTRWQEGIINTPAALNNEQQTRNAIAVIQRAIEEIKTSAGQMDALISNYNDTIYIKNAIAAIENMQVSVTSEEYQSAYRYYTIASGDLQRSLTGRKEELDRGRDLLDGRRRVSADGVATVDRYPAEALETLTSMLSALTGDLQRGNSLLTYYRNEPDATKTEVRISALQRTASRNIDEMASIRAEALALAETARSRIALAEAHKQEGERLFREAQAAYQRQSFDVARDRLQRASDRFNNSLEVQESSSQRRTWDAQLLNLGQAISVAENEMIIAEVRGLLTNARNTYFAGDFQQAEDSLIRARNRWRITNPQENEEVLHWLSIVQGAMSARSGRVIPPTAPLYPEMSQLLSEARKNYEEGVRYINAGNRSLGLAKFNEARQQTREVRLIFPLNQEAGILELRMEQFTDPAAFSASFEQRLRNAQAGTKQRSMESFADLQNLAEINPRYPNIRAILTQAEYDMGLRPPPPDPRDLARSRELTASAGRILEENITSLYEVALSNINQAINLNPENTEATRIKDRLLNRMSVPGAIVLSSEDENEYQRAMRELQAGNNLVANAIVERLMQNPRNRNITKLIELQRRIQLVL
jgi:hypothetical protein